MEQPSSTLFIADLPFTMTEPDLQQLFQNEHGFKSARLRRDRNSHLVGFVEFDDANSAARAKDLFTNHRSLSDNPLTIHFSHSQGGSNFSGERKRINKDHAPRHTQRSSPNSTLSPPGPTSNPGQIPPFFPGANPIASLGYPYQNSTLFANLAPPSFPPPLPEDASSTLYVEGLPSDATEREVAHIFRQWPGYQSLRLLPKVKEPSPTGKFPATHTTPHTYHLCFVEFDNKNQSSMAMYHLNGYRFDKNDSKGLTISYAKTDRKDKKAANINNNNNSNPRKPKE